MLGWLTSISALFFASLPATTNYQLNSYGFGSGGTANSGTATYSLEGMAGEVGGIKTTTVTYGAKPGFIETQQANLPKLSNLHNNGGAFYNKLRFIIDQQGNPGDALYALSISTDNFSSDIRYVKSDNTVGTSLSLSDYQSYATWGGATGGDIIGLNAGTTYYVRVKATQGKFTESDWGPISSAATSTNPSITFSVVTSSQSTPPFTIALGQLLPDTVTSGPDTINVTLDSNATNGAHVYISGQNGGLLSSGSLIASATADLTSAPSGFGVRNATIGQTSGGPFTVVSPYGGSGNNVGLIDSTLRTLYNSSGPITNGTATLQIKAKASAATAEGSDYTEVLTLVAAGSF